MATYEESFNAAVNMIRIGISPSEMSMALDIDRKLSSASCNLKSDMCTKMAKEASEDLFSSCKRICEAHPDIPVCEAVDAVIRCYFDVDMDVERMKTEVDSPVFCINYLL